MKKTKIHIKTDFNGLHDFQRFIDNETSRLSSANANTFERTFNDESVEGNLSWYGKSRIDEIKNIKQFSYPEIYQSIKNSVLEQFNSQLFSKLTKKKIDFNENVGVFSFDRVMMGMQRKKELFCQQKNEVVQWSDVDVLENKEIVTKLEKYSVNVRNAMNKDGRPKIKTSNKKIFVYFPQKAKKTNAVEIFLGNALAGNIRAETAIYKAIPAIILAEELIKKGYKVKVNYVFGSGSGSDICLGIVPIKNFNEPLDTDKLLLMTCDMAFVRYHSYKSVVAIFNHFGLFIDNSLGYPVYNNSLKQICKDKPDFFDTESTKLFLPETWGEAEAIKVVKDTIKQLSNEN